MNGVFDDEERELAPPRRDTELTLGSGTLFALGFGLLMLCGLCFGLGYAAGHRSSSETDAAASSPEAPTNLQASGAHPKPSATPQSDVAQAEQAVVDTPPADQAPPASDGSPAPNPSPAAPPSASVEPNQIKPALLPTPNSPQPAQPPPSSAVQPAFASAVLQRPGLMVQIAAVSNPEDANVLVNALLKRGYAVIARRDGADGLIHVRIGPFNTTAEANQWRKKLLDDGYNAVVQP